MSKKARRRQHRRDRRKAKASKFRREGKSKARVGHGASGSLHIRPEHAEASLESWLSRKGIAPVKP